MHQFPKVFSMLREMSTFYQIQNVMDHSTMKNIKRTVKMGMPH